MTRLGQLIATGRTSRVYEFGRGRVVKVPRSGVPARWAAVEAEITAAVHSQGGPTPAVHGMVAVDGREAIVFERIDGPSMWQQICSRQCDVSTVASQLAEIQLSIHELAPPASMLCLGDRVRQKIKHAKPLSTDERDEALRLVGALPHTTVLCHGDLHPGNVLMSGQGPIVIDWYDAAVGSPIADVVRSSLLMRPRPAPGGLPHLPGSTPDMLGPLHDHYVRAVLADSDVDPGLARCWEAVLAVGRLAERAEPDDSDLIALWRGRRGKTASPLIEAILSR